MFAELVKPETFAFFARYILAGFIIYSVRRAYIVGERPQLAEIAFDIVVLSLLNQLVWFGLLAFGKAVLHAARSPLDFSGIDPQSGFAFYLQVLVLPVLLGMLYGFALRGRWFEGAMRKAALPLVDPIARAYDHVFSQRSTGFVILTFQDDIRIYGYHGPASRAGRDPNRSEIFLERLYFVEEDGTWVETVPARSALIRLDGLRSIEFIEERT
jgi:hypothetical protein